MSMRRLTLPFLFVVCVPAFLYGETLEWMFTIDEQQIKNGPESDGSTNSPGVGTGHVTYDSTTNEISYSLQWNGLVGELTKLHIHGPADENSSNPQHVVEIFGPPTVPAEFAGSSATVVGSQELTTLIQTGFDPLAPDTILDIMRSGQSYLNVHTTVFGTGEIRGNLGRPVPEPSSLMMITIGGLLISQIRRRSSC